LAHLYLLLRCSLPCLLHVESTIVTLHHLQVLNARNDVPVPSYAFFMETLANTVRPLLSRHLTFPPCTLFRIVDFISPPTSGP
jgi:hypothetical protein